MVTGSATSWSGGCCGSWATACRPTPRPPRVAGTRTATRSSDTSTTRPRRTWTRRTRRSAWTPRRSCDMRSQLGCLRGVATLTGFGLAVEVGDWDRLTGSTVGAYLGLVPTESSSGQSRSRGSITKTGNTYARRLLVEAAWQHLKPLPHPRGHHEGQVGAGAAGRPGPRTCRQPAAPQDSGSLRCCPEGGPNQLLPTGSPHR